MYTSALMALNGCWLLKITHLGYKLSHSWLLITSIDFKAQMENSWDHISVSVLDMQLDYHNHGSLLPPKQSPLCNCLCGAGKNYVFKMASNQSSHPLSIQIRM